MLKHVLAAVLCLLPALGFAQEKPRAILVLDASGSMWGQIDGKAKITIAQEVIGELLQSLPAEQELGLTVYGHRRKGDCSDIETMILPGGDTRSAIAKAVNAITPKGKTPLSAAVIQAAEALKYTEERATVILISDGRETCELDPCAVGRNLEKAGIDFTAHVIGFDISDAKERAELQCLAEETGGTFRTASNASELNDALQVIAEPEPTPFEIGFRATAGENGPVILDLLVWELFDKDGASLATTSSKAKLMSVDLLPGQYRIEVLRPEDEATAQTDFTVSDSNMTVTLVLPVLIPPASLNAPDTAVAGSNVNIEWDGPNSDNDYITVAEIGSGGRQYVDFEYTRKGTPVTLKMPLKAGQYQLRYVLGQGREIIARRAITITPVTATLAAPEVVPAGGTVPVEWDGPNYKGDYIALAKPGAKANQYETFEYTRNGSPAALKIPTIEGKYVLRYIASGPDRMALASRDITVEAVKATLEFNPTVPAGSKMQVTWTGPDDDRDYLAIAEIGSRVNEEQTYSYTRDSVGDSITIKVPTEPGTYELRYIHNGKPKSMLAVEKLVVEPVSASLEFNPTVPAGSKMQVTWTGPNDDRDYLAIAKIGSRANEELAYSYTRDSVGDSITIKVPTEPGTYELRYIQNGSPKAILVVEKLVVEPVTASLEFNSTVPAGSKMQVTWVGPNDDRDYLAIAEIGSRVNEELAYSYTRDSVGDSVTLKVPTEPGTYELRYIQNGSPKAMLAVEKLVVEAVTASLEFNSTVPAGSKMQVTWTGPNDDRDYLAIAKIGSRANEELAYSYTNDSVGDSITIKVPTEPGTYELRYIQNGSPKAMLAVEKLVVEPVTASLEFNPTVPAGGKLLVTWKGPNDDRDYLAIAKVGSSIGEEVTYVYTRDSAGDSININTPAEPGTYELRYIQNGSPKAMLAAEKLVVEPITASLEAAATVAPGGNLVVSWQGPDYKNDYIAISRVGDDGYEVYTYTSTGSPLIVKAPEGPGDYELRYVMSQNRRVLFSQPLSVK